MRSLRCILLFPLLALLLAGCSTGTRAAGPLHLIDDTGAHVSLTGPAHRVISLGPSNSEIMLALGLKADLVGVGDESPKYLPQPYRGQIAGVTEVGDAYRGLDIEKIVRLKPALVLAVPATADLKKLRALHLPVLVLLPKSLAGIYHDIALIGRATGHARRAAALAAKMKSQVAAIAKAVEATKSRPTTFVELSRTLYTVGPGSFIDALVHLAGGVNVVDRVSRRAYPQISSEQLIKLDPQVIILQDQASVRAGQVAKRPGWAGLRAVREGRVYSNVSPDDLSSPGPAVVDGLRQLAEDLHPTLHLPN